TAIAYEERAGVAVDAGMLLRTGRVGLAAALVDADVAVRVDQPRHDPALAEVAGAFDGFVGDHAVAYVQLAPPPAGEHDPADLECLTHGADAIAPPSPPWAARFGPRIARLRGRNARPTVEAGQVRVPANCAAYNRS